MTVLPPAARGMRLVQDLVKSGRDSPNANDAMRHWRSQLRFHWPGLVVLLVAFGARRFRVAPEFVSSDAADLPAAVVRLLCGPTPFQEVFEKLALYRLGGVEPLVVFAQAWLSRQLGTSLDAASWVLITSVVSAVGCTFAYLLVTALASRGAGVLAGLAVALSPIHIMTGRHLGAPWAFESTLQLVLLWLAVRLFQQPNSGLRAAFHVTLAVYLWCGNQMPAVFVPLGYALAVGLAQEASAPLGRRLAERVGSLWCVVPLSSAAALAYVTFGLREGHLAHALFDKDTQFGWHVDNWFGDLVRDVGWLPAFACVAALLLAPLQSRSLLAWRHLLWVYCVAYSLPFWILIPPGETLTAGYIVYSVGGALLTLCCALDQLRTGLFVKRGLGAALCAWLLVASTSSAFGLWRAKWLGIHSFQGAYQAEIGASAAAAFIRRDSGDKTSKVFSDAFGGGGLEPPVMKVYFRRPYFARFDARRNGPYREVRSSRGTIDYLVTLPSNRRRVREVFPQFHLLASVRAANDAARELLRIYGKRKPEQVAQLDARAGLAEHAATYPGVCSR